MWIYLSFWIFLLCFPCLITSLCTEITFWVTVLPFLSAPLVISLKVCFVTSLSKSLNWFFFYFCVKIIAEGDGSKIYVSCIAFRDPVCEDIAEAYQIPANLFADKCICLVSRSPSFRILRDTLEEIFLLCFSSSGSRYE